MIPWFWIPISLIIGACIGFCITALVCANEVQKSKYIK